MKLSGIGIDTLIHTNPSCEDRPELSANNGPHPHVIVEPDCNVIYKHRLKVIFLLLTSLCQLAEVHILY